MRNDGKVHGVPSPKSQDGQLATTVVTSPDSFEVYLTRGEAMELLGVQKTAFARLIRDHDIPSCTLTRRPLYRKSDLVKLIERHMVTKLRVPGANAQ
jgi:hypothetical protein